MARLGTRRLLLAISSLVVALAAAGGVALASSSRHARRGMSVAQVVRYQGRSGRSRVIVILRAQFRSLPATQDHVSARRIAITGSQQRLIAQVRRSGGVIHHTYDVLNAFAATASAAEVA